MLSMLLALTSIAAAEPTFQQLHSDAARATSYLKSNWNKYSENYHPNYVLDDNPVTAWVEGVSGQGEGEVLSWDVSALSSARAVRIRIKNGYQKSAGLFAANSAPKDVQLQVWRGADVVAEQQVTLEKKMGWQEVVLATDGKGLDHIELQVLSVYPGSKYKDTCISDVETWVDSDVTYNGPFEQSKHETLEAWITERVKTAEYFANLPPTYPFAATRFSETSTATDKAAVESLLAPLRAAHDALGGDGPWFSAAFTGAAPIRPDRLHEVDYLLKYLRADGVSFFEATKKSGDRQSEEYEDGGMSFKQTNYELEHKDGATHRVRFATKTVIDGRGTDTYDMSLLLEFDAEGRLRMAYVRYDDVAAEGYVQRGERLVDLHWSDAQIDRVVVHEVAEHTSVWEPAKSETTFKRREYTPDR